MATLLFTWAAVYGYVGVYFCALHARRGSRQEYLAFGLLSLGLMVWSFGSGIAADATSMDRALLGFSVQFIGGFTASALFVQFAAFLVNARAKTVARASYGVSLVGFLAVLTGWLLHPIAREPNWGPGLVSDMVEPRLTLVAVVLLSLILAFCVWGVLTIARGVREAPDLKPLVWAAGTAVAAGIYELISRTTHGRTFFLLDHCALLPILTVSFLLQRRFVRAADDLGDRTEELRQSYGELRVVQEELVRKEQLAAVGELSAVIAHEVRNPLAIIKNAVSGLRRPTLRDADRGVLLAILEEEVDRLNRLARNLLDYARPVAPQGQPLDLLELAQEAGEAARLGREFPDRYEIAVEDDGLAPPVHGDPDLLRQALTNVAANAMHAMPEGGTLRVRSSTVSGAHHRSVRLEIEDEGSGMSEEVLAKAKDPFFTTRPAGTGLGLAIVERVIRNHGGSIHINSEEGRGTTVVVTLPCERTSAMPGVPS